jgi:hypothetical protein
MNAAMQVPTHLEGLVESDLSQEDIRLIKDLNSQEYSPETIAEITGKPISSIEHVIASETSKQESLTLIVELITQGACLEYISTATGVSISELELVSKLYYQAAKAFVGELGSNTSASNDQSSNKELTYANGDVYSGSLRNGKRHGRGHLRTANGEYNGDFVEDKMHGQGRFTLKDGTYFEGEFVEDWLSGIGRSVYKEGHTYEGTFKGLMRHGKGKYFQAGGVAREIS